MSLIIQFADHDGPSTVDLAPIPVRDDDAFCDFCGDAITTLVTLVVTSHGGPVYGDVTEVACLHHLAEVNDQIESVRTA